jgi:protease IV
MNEYKIWLAKIATLVFGTIGIMLVLGAVAASTDKKGPQVAVIDLQGVISDSSDVLKALYKEVYNKETKAIVLRVDSPGGAVAPSEEVFNAIRRLKNEKPIVASMGSVAASGGLYSALAANKIFCQPGTQTGSIGVIMQLPNFTKIAATVGFDMQTIKSGNLKDTGNQFRPMTSEERAYLEDTAKKVHQLFISAVVEGRNLPEDKVREFADGRMIIGKEAKELGLVDEFGDVYDAARAALALAGVELEDGRLPKLHYANRKGNFLEKALNATLNIPDLVGAAGSYPTLQFLPG